MLAIKPAKMWRLSSGCADTAGSINHLFMSQGGCPALDKPVANARKSKQAHLLQLHGAGAGYELAGAHHLRTGSFNVAGAPVMLRSSLL